MRTSKVIEALNNYSPKGLCRDQVTINNRWTKPDQFVGCAMGCLGAAYVNEQLDRKPTKSERVCLRDNVDSFISSNVGTIVEDVHKFYGLTDSEIEHIVKANDDVGIDDVDQSIDKTAKRLMGNFKLPRDLARTIVRLRRKNINFNTKK